MGTLTSEPIPQSTSESSRSNIPLKSLDKALRRADLELKDSQQILPAYLQHLYSVRTPE